MFRRGRPCVPGDDRGYTRAQYLELVRIVRRHIPDIVLTSDVIVGFPGETEEEFQDTLAVISEARFDALFTFIYSKRAGTPASRLADPEPKEATQRRFDAHIRRQNQISGEKHRAMSAA